MPQSLSKVIIHITFSTKDREPWLDRDVRPRMHAYVATICRDLNAEALRVGGVADHLHIVITLPRTLSQAAMVETLKKTSSKWIKGAEFEIPAVLLATRLRRILSKPQSA
jgi:putative transposase